MQLEKVTTARRTEDKRRYDDACAAAHGMDLIGERWSMPLIRELLLGPRRFSDLRASLRGISANVLTQRLEGLEAAGVLVRRKLPPPASVQVYELTPWGYEAAPIFQALGRWAVRSPHHDPTRPFSPVSLMLSLRTMFSDAAARRPQGADPARHGWRALLLDPQEGRDRHRPRRHRRSGPDASPATRPRSPATSMAGAPLDNHRGRRRLEAGQAPAVTSSPCPTRRAAAA